MRETALDVSPALLPLIARPAPAAKPWVETSAGWRVMENWAPLPVVWAYFLHVTATGMDLNLQLVG